MRRSSRLSTAVAVKGGSIPKSAVSDKTAKAAIKPITSTSQPTAAKSSTEPPTVPFPTSSAFNTFLSGQSATYPQGIWLQIAKKHTLIPTVTYDEAVDTALCHGWIDGQRRPLDAQYFLQRFTPRRKKSLWSKRNVEKIAALTAAGRMTQRGLDEVTLAKADGRWDKAYSGSKDMEVPRDFQAALEGNEEAKRTFDALSKGNRYKFLWRIETAKKEETRTKRIRDSIEILARGETLP